MMSFQICATDDTQFIANFLCEVSVKFSLVVSEHFYYKYQCPGISHKVQPLSLLRANVGMLRKVSSL